jgi:hypothetical protein
MVTEGARPGGRGPGGESSRRVRMIMAKIH